MKKMKSLEAKPINKYNKGERLVVSLRLTESMISRLKKESKTKNYTVTEIVENVLEMYFEIADSE